MSASNSSAPFFFFLGGEEGWGHFSSVVDACRDAPCSCLSSHDEWVTAEQVKNQIGWKWVWNDFLLLLLPFWALCPSAVLSCLDHLWPINTMLSIIHKQKASPYTLPVHLYFLWVCVILQVKNLKTQRCSGSTRYRWTVSRISTSVWKRRWLRARSSPCTQQRTRPGPDRRSVFKQLPLHCSANFDGRFIQKEHESSLFISSDEGKKVHKHLFAAVWLMESCMLLSCSIMNNPQSRNLFNMFSQDIDHALVTLYMKAKFFSSFLFFSLSFMCIIIFPV